MRMRRTWATLTGLLIILALLALFWLAGSRQVEEAIARPAPQAVALGHPIHQSPPYLNQHPWPMGGREQLRSGYSSVLGPGFNVVKPEPWPYLAGADILAPPAIDRDGVAYVGADDGKVRALWPSASTADGLLRWETGVDGPVRSAPALKQEVAHAGVGGAVRVFATTIDGRVTGLDAASGAVAWTTEVTGSVAPTSHPAVRTNPDSGLARLYLATDAGIYGLREIVGGGSLPGVQLDWENNVVGTANAVALSPGGGQVYATQGNDLFAIDAFTGATLCTFPLPDVVTAPAVHPNGLIFLGTDGAELLLAEIQTSTCDITIDTVPVGAPVAQPPALAPDGRAIVLAGSELVAVDWPGGRALWSVDVSPAQPYPPVVDGRGTTFIAQEDGTVDGITAGGDVLFSEPTAPAGVLLTSPAVDESGRLYLGSDDGQVKVLAGVPAYQLAYEATLYTRTRDIYLRPRTYEGNGNRWHAVDADAREGQPAFSLDGRQMAFLSDRTGVQAAYLATAGGRGPLNASDYGPLAGYEVLDPAFSPVDRDGRSRLPAGDPVLALTRSEAGGRHVFLVDLGDLRQGGAVGVATLSDWFLQEIGDDPVSNPYQAQMAFAPDGSHVAYSTCYGIAGERTEELILVQLQSGSPARTVVASAFYGAGSEDCGGMVGFHPAFSPDGDYLVYQGGDEGTLNLYDVRGRQAAGLFHSAFSTDIEASHPAWSPDGVYIAFSGLIRSSGEQGIRSKPLTGQASDLGAEIEPEQAAHPVFHPLRLPWPYLGSNPCGSSPQSDTLAPEREQPRAPVRLYGCGLDLLFPDRNRVDYPALDAGEVPGDVLSRTLDLGNSGRGVLTTLAPYEAGDGQIMATTPFGVAPSEPFTVIPLPLLLEPQRARRLEQIRIVGFGMEAADEGAAGFWQSEAYFSDQSGAIDEPAETVDTGISQCGGSGPPCPGGYSGKVQWLDVEVPPEAVTGTVAVENGDGDRGTTSIPFELQVTPVDLSVSQAETPACELLVGGSGQYVYEVYNYGPNDSARTEFELGIPSSAEAAATAGSGDCAVGGNSVACDLGGIPAFNSVRVSVTVTATRANLYTTTASVANVFRDTDPGNNSTSHPFRFHKVNTSTLDITVEDIEITQGLQDLAKSIEFIQDKETVVRVYLDSGGVAVKEVPVVLYEIDGVGSRIGPKIYPELEGGETCYRQPAGPRRRHLSANSVNFRLPPSQTSAFFNFKVVVDEEGILPETDRSNNSGTAFANFYQSEEICLVTFPIRNLGHDGDPSNDITNALGNTIPIAQPDANILVRQSEFLTRATSLLPTPAMHVYLGNRVIRPNRNPFLRRYHLSNKDNHGSIILNRLKRWRRNSSPPKLCDANNWPVHYVGMADEDISDAGTPGIFNGLGHRPGQELIVRLADGYDRFNKPYGGRTLAHELGHNFRRKHVNCPPSGDGSPDGTDPNYPYDVCDLGPDDSTSFFGVDVARPLYANYTVISPTDKIGSKEVGDLMSYAPYRWTSDYTWNAVYFLMTGRTPSLPLSASQSVTEVYDITGLITGTDSLEPEVLFDPIYQVDTEIMPAENMAEALAAQPDSADYRLNLLDSEGSVLSSAYFTPTAPSDPLGPVNFLSFDLLLPYEPGGARFQLLHQDQEIGTRPISPEPPAVDVTFPEGGEVGETLHVEWQVGDPDGDRIFAMVQYSGDGGASWQVLNMDLLSRTLSIPTTYLAGNDEPLGLVRVVATDGANTSSDVSAPFQLPAHPPELYINQPADGATITRSAPTLYGTGFDAEDGPLLPEALNWHVEGPALPGGVTATGRQLRLEGLTPGEYEVILEAADSDGMVGGAAHTFTVAACVSPNAPRPEIALDGGDVLLSWTPDDSQRSFVVYRSSEPYFNPATATEIGTTVENFFRVSGAANSSAFYYVEALGCDGTRAVTPAGQRGTFAFDLETP